MKLCFSIGSVLLLAATTARGQSTPDLSQYRTVLSWLGTYKATFNGSWSGKGPLGRPVTMTMSASTTMTMNLDKRKDTAEALVWQGSFQGTTSFEGTVVMQASHPGGCDGETIHFKGTRSVPAVSTAYAMLAISKTTGRYLVQPADILMWPVTVTFQPCPNPTPSKTQNAQVAYYAVAANFLEVTVPAEPRALIADQISILAYRPVTDTLGVPHQMPWQVSWNLEPIRLVVDPKPLGTWMPEAGPLEDTPPSPDKDLDIQAYFEGSDGKPLTGSKVKAKKFIFELVNTSKQPGIAMNWPERRYARSTFDLQFLPARNSSLLIRGEGQFAETPDGEYANVSAKLTPFDYGGWSVLRVTAEMPDGSRIPAVLRGASETDIRLPKRAAKSLIADIWKQRNGVTSLPDSDDFESDPPGLADCPGDGLTLYEEYRGFMENRNHIFGNPRKKDLFVDNLGGAEFEPGIWAFSDATGLEVHKDVRLSERNYDLREINANFSDQAPHQPINQHVVVIAPGPPYSSTQLLGTNPDMRARPRTTERIDIGWCGEEQVQPRGEYSYTAFTPDRNISKTDKLFSLHRVVAHMLAHAVGIEHHAPDFSDWEQHLTFHYPDDPDNATGAPYFTGEGGLEAGWIVMLRDEKTGADYAPQYLGVVQLKLAENLTAPFRIVEPKEYLRRFYLFVAQMSGAHSGNELCMMRRYHANAYTDKAAPSQDYYVIPPGTEPAGLDLCDSPTGTGINDKDRDPRSRHGDAGWSGGCRKWTCVNDNAPLISKSKGAW